MRLSCALLGILVSLPATSAWPQSPPACVTHFYNQSNFQWSIYNFDGNERSLFIAPNSTVAINWGTTSAVTVSANLPNHPYLQRLQVQQSGSCVVIKQQGPPGPLSVNKPGNGDITTCTGGC